jgi:HEAT repeat protein
MRDDPSMSDPEALRPVASFSEENREVVAVLRGDDDDSRLDELYALGEVDDELADELLRLLASDVPERVRGAAAIALGPSLETCDNELDDDGRLEVGPLSTSPLSQAGYDRVVRGLQRAYQDPALPALVRRRALEAAVRSPQEWQEGAVRAAWAGSDPAWRLTAVFCMGYLYRTDFAAEIAAAFRSPAEEMRREAMLAAGRRCLEELLPEVTLIARDPKAPEDLRYAAVEAIGELGGEEDVELLEELTKTANQELVDVAWEALEALQMKLELEDLDDEADDEDDDLDWR